jgi:hypothetical protein
MEKMVIKKNYIVVDLIFNTFWSGKWYTQNPDKVKYFESPEEALIEIEEKILSRFKCLPEIKEIYKKI